MRCSASRRRRRRYIFTLREEQRRRGREEQAGGPACLASLTDGLPSRLNVGHYARTAREKASLRQLIQLASEVQRGFQSKSHPELTGELRRPTPTP
jgi:replicative DNA helicase